MVFYVYYRGGNKNHILLKLLVKIRDDQGEVIKVKILAPGSVPNHCGARIGYKVQLCPFLIYIFGMLWYFVLASCNGRSKIV